MENPWNENNSYHQGFLYRNGENIHQKNKEICKDKYKDIVDLEKDPVPLTFPNRSYNMTYCNFLKNDPDYVQEIEALFPKEIRRKKYERVDEITMKKRKNWEKYILENPDKFKDKVGYKEFLDKEIEKKEKREKYFENLKKNYSGSKKSQRKSNKKEPWENILSKEEKNLPKEEFDLVVTKYYHKFTKETDTSLNEYYSQNKKIKDFVKWYKTHSSSSK